MPAERQNDDSASGQALSDGSRPNAAVELRQDARVSAGMTQLVPGTGTQILPEAGTQVLPGTGTQVLPSSGTQVLPEEVARASSSPGTQILPSSGPFPGSPSAGGTRALSEADAPSAVVSSAPVSGGTRVLPSETNVSVDRRDGASHDRVPPRPPASADIAPPAPRVADTAPRRRQPAAAPAPGSALPSAGTRIGQYEIIRELGAGGMGSVFLARDDRLGRLTAIKFLRSGNPELTRRFLIEGQATARCSHGNIVVIYEVGEHDGNPFMVLEYLQGQTLTAVIRKSAPLAPSRGVELIAAVVRALACAHDLGIIHRDLKPDNIVLTDAGTIKVLDFGIAKVLQDERQSAAAAGDLAGDAAGGAPAARTGLVGTLMYMSPEQWGVGGSIDHRTDIWATGLILFQMLAVRHPIEMLGATPFDAVKALDRPMPALLDAAPLVPAALAEIVDRCLRKRKEDRFADAGALLRALEPLLPGRSASRAVAAQTSPYAGLRAFQEEDADHFFGRDRDIAAVVTRIRDWPLMAVVGPSGIGKSSFVRAGVAPALKSSGESWETLVVRPGRDPALALAGLLAPLLSSSPNVADDVGAQQQLAERLVGEPGMLGSALRGRSRRTGQRLLVFVDQFEELYTLGADPDARRAFTACLAAAADDATSPVRVLVSVRSDFLGRVAEDPRFMNELAKGLFFLGPVTADGLREAIVEPAEMAGFRFESPAIVDDMLGYLAATPGALPLLQFTASQLWEARDRGRRMLTARGYAELGGITGALVRHADLVVSKLASATLARALFLRLVTPERTRAVRSLDELREIGPDKREIDQLVDQLVESRLLVVQTGGGAGGATAEIVHESLIGTWPTLRRWLDDSHEDSVFLDQLQAGARQWQSKNKDSGLLWGGEMVDELQRFLRRYRGALPEASTAFTQAIFAQRQRGERRRRRLRATAGALLVGTLAATVVALVVIRNAQKAAESNAVAATQAEGEARRRLREVEEKERQRLAAEKEAATANDRVKLTNAELADKNVELTGALDRAKEQRQRAEESQAKAEADEREARDAEERARRSAAQTEKLLVKERERANRLTQQLGSALVETLR